MSGLLADPALLQRVWMLQSEYAALVDDHERLEDWPELFSEDGAYSIYTRDNFERGLPTAILIDDSRLRLLDRVTVIRELWKGHFDEQTAVHTISMPRLVARDGDCVEAVTPFIAALAKLDQQPVTLAGQYRDRIRLAADGSARFREKKVVLQNLVVPTYLVYPL